MPRGILGRGQGPREIVDEKQERAAEQGRGRQQRAVIGADQHPREMRHGEADPGDHAADRDLRRDEERHEGEREPARRLDADAEASRFVLVEGEHVEAPAQAHQERACGEHESGEDRDLFGIRRREAAEQPEDDERQLVSGSAANWIRPTRAEKSAETMSPASTSTSVEPVRPSPPDAPEPTRRARAKTQARDPSPNANAPATTAGKAAVRRSASAPPKDAPEETPMMCGPTSGLRKTPCRAAPDAPSAAPARIAMTMRGRRTVSTIASAVWSPAALDRHDLRDQDAGDIVDRDGVAPDCQRHDRKRREHERERERYPERSRPAQRFRRGGRISRAAALGVATQSRPW